MSSSKSKSNILSAVINVTPELISKAKGNAVVAIEKAFRAAGFKAPDVGNNGEQVYFNRYRRTDIFVILPKKVSEFVSRMNAAAASPKLKKPTSLVFTLKYDPTSGYINN